MPLSARRPARAPPPDVPPERYTDFGALKIGHTVQDRVRNAVYLAPAAAGNREEP